MRKNDSGITLISLIITIILLLILATIGISSGISTVKSSKFTKFTTEMKIMQQKVNELYDSYTNNRTVEAGGSSYTGQDIANIGKDISNVSEEQRNEAFLASGDNTEGYKYYDITTIKSLNIDGVESEFFVNIAKRSIISVEGFEYEGKKYYTLDQLPDGLYNVEYDNIVGDISFDITAEATNGNGKIYVNNISYNGYVNKWQVRYRLKVQDGEQENSWNITDEFTGNEVTINVEQMGFYEVQVFHRDEIASNIEEIEVNPRPGLEVGDYVNYTYDTVEKGYPLPQGESGYTDDQTIEQTSGLKWRILAIHDNGTVDLISETPTSQNVHLGGALGYNNGVLLINDICKELYSNSTLGTEARSIDLKDIEDQMNETGKTARNEYTNSSSGTQYGNTKTYGNGNSQYPNLYAQENGSGINTETVKTDGIDVNADGYTEPTKETSSTADEELTVTQTFYYFSNTLSKYFYNSQVYNMIFETNSYYWLASRYVTCNSDYATIGLRYLNNSSLTGNGMFSSNGSTGSYFTCLRPIVSLGTSIQITPCEGENSNTNMHQIATEQ